MKTLIKRLASGACRGLHIALLLIVASRSIARAEEEKLYYFVDENGVTHLSNTPSDPRYKPLRPAQRGKAPATSLTSDPSPAEEPLVPDEPAPPPGMEDQSSQQVNPEPVVVPEPVPEKQR